MFVPAILITLGAFAEPKFRGDVDDPITSARAPAIPWNARTVEHLLNRAGFGARPEEIEDALVAGPDACIGRLVARRANVEVPFVEWIADPSNRRLKELSDEEQKAIKRDVSERDRRQLLEYMGWWVDRMVEGDDPLLDRMTLFWHGFFTTSIEQVKRSYPVLRQNQFLRANALGRYSDLLRGIVKDPAMLVYLNNNVNRKGKGNENLARELMELFSLGVGNFTERDVKEAARALTGRTAEAGEYVYAKGQHDEGEKTVLGTKGKLDGDALVDILLGQDACPRFVSRKIIAYLEGVEPDPARVEDYAAFLRANDFAIQPFLERLFRDPAFYRDEIVGARVQSPIDFLVGSARRLDVEPPALMIGAGAALLGQRVFAPPSVKGWDEGHAWITTSALMQRGNLGGLLLGIVKTDDVLSQADLLAAAPPTKPASAGEGGEMGGAMGEGSSGEPPMESRQKREMQQKSLAKPAKGTGFAYETLRRVEGSGWAPGIHLSARLAKLGCKTDGEIVGRLLDELLAIQAPAATRAKLLEFLTDERVKLSKPDGRFLEAGPDAERVLRRLAHLMLSLPEAQLM